MLKNENCTRRIDDLGRVVIPKGLRNRCGFSPNEELDVYTLEYNGRIFVCFGKRQEEEKGKYEIAVQVLRDLGLEVPSSLKEKLE